jgi:FkbH-like protein
MNTRIKEHIRGGRYREALECILRVSAAESFDTLDSTATQLQKVPEHILAERVGVRKRLAILGGSTTQFLRPLIHLFALQRGVALTIYESEFGLFEQEIWAESQALREFKPDIIHFQVSSRNLNLPVFSEESALLVQAEAERFAALYRTARERFQCAVIVNNFETYCERPYGALDVAMPGTRNSMIRALNDRLVRALPSGVYVHDIEQLSALCGKHRWFDERLWNETRTAMSFECHAFYADRLASMIGALFGRSKKCLVLDLDNTLWGGVIGDDGLHGIRLGAGEPGGEAFQRFQHYVLALHARGVLLAVASKNDPQNALAAFREHPDMVLREADISCFVINWEPKDHGLRTIAQRLNIGLDSLVFFDDNAAERELVRSRLPEVTVIDVPEDPSEFVRALDRANPFDILAITQEDQIRGQLLQQNEERELLANAAENYDDFLQKMEMRAVAEPITVANLHRVTQLINKTNQFNLTTRRLTEAEVRALLDRPDIYTSTIKLDDRFGSNGLISVVIGYIEADVLIIDSWLMSCRVLKRGVELLEMERLIEFCRDRGLCAIIGRYLPTVKNRLVSDHYATLGFVQIAGDSTGTSWRFALTEHTAAPPHFIAMQSN